MDPSVVDVTTPTLVSSLRVLVSSPPNAVESLCNVGPSTAELILVEFLKIYMSENHRAESFR